MFEPKSCCALAVAMLCSVFGAHAQPAPPSPAPRTASPSSASNGRAAALNQQNGNQQGDVIQLRPYIVQDSQLGIEAFRFLMPADWKVEGGVLWGETELK